MLYSFQAIVAPSRGRGSKRRTMPLVQTVLNVAPSRGRGSKLPVLTAEERARVSPLHGGVDRNFNHRNTATRETGRPFTGAWIETIFSLSLAMAALSPLHGGVDRNHKGQAIEETTACRPFTGAWIETVAQGQYVLIWTSPLHGGVDRNCECS